MTIDGQARIDAARSMEFPGRPNSFSEFVSSHEAHFLTYARLTKSLRETEAQARIELAPLMGELIGNARNLRGANPKRLRQLEADNTEKIFNHNSILATISMLDKTNFEASRAGKTLVSKLSSGETPPLHVSLEVGREMGGIARGKTDNARKTLESSPKSVQEGIQASAYSVGDFQEKYAYRVGPMIIEARSTNGQLSSELRQYLTSGYESLVDVLEFLSESEFAEQREVVRAFFRDLVYQDPSRRNQPNLISQVREYWQKVGPGKFDPVIFDRFWEDLNRSAQKNDVIGWVKFGAMVAKLSRDETGGEEPEAREIRSAVARVPFEFWPKPLRDSYAFFIQRDAAIMTEAIRSKSQQLFPRNHSEPLRPSADVFESKKRLRFETISEEETEEATSDAEAIDKKYQFALAKRVSTNIYDINILSEDELPSTFRNLAKDAGDDPDMTNDVMNMLALLHKNPTGPGREKLVRPPVFMNLGRNGRVSMMRLDPSSIPELKLNHPQSWRLRIVYALMGDTILVRRVYTHQEMDKLQRTSPGML